MRSVPHGRPTSDVEVTIISKQGLWLLVSGREYFLPFDQFPWFQDAAIGDVMDVTLPHPHHLYWPSLDIDLAVDSIEHPERYPLISAARPRRKRAPAPVIYAKEMVRDPAGIRESGGKYVKSMRKLRSKHSRRDEK